MKIHINTVKCTITILEQESRESYRYKCENGVTIVVAACPAAAAARGLSTLYLRGAEYCQDSNPIHLYTFNNLLTAYASLKEFCCLRGWSFETNIDFKRMKIS